MTLSDISYYYKYVYPFILNVNWMSSFCFLGLKLYYLLYRGWRPSDKSTESGLRNGLWWRFIKWKYEGTGFRRSGFKKRDGLSTGWFFIKGSSVLFMWCDTYKMVTVMITAETHCDHVQVWARIKRVLPLCQPCKTACTWHHLETVIRCLKCGCMWLPPPSLSGQSVLVIVPI